MPWQVNKHNATTQRTHTHLLTDYTVSTRCIVESRKILKKSDDVSVLRVRNWTARTNLIVVSGGTNEWNDAIGWHNMWVRGLTGGETRRCASMTNISSFGFYHSNTVASRYVCSATNRRKKKYLFEFSPRLFQSTLLSRNLSLHSLLTLLSSLFQSFDTLWAFEIT